MKDAKHQRRLFIGLTAACFMLVGLGWLFAQESGDREQFVLLRNGRVLEGRLRQNLDHWILGFDSGASLRLESKDIDLLGDSMTHLYQQMQQRTDREQTGERIEIIQFCLRHQLLDDAQNEIAWLVQDGITPDISQRLEASLSALRRKTQLETRRSLEEAEIRQASRLEGSKEDQGVASAEYQVVKDETSAVQQADFVESEFSTFVRQVQPHLLIGCSQALCHGSQGSTGLVFERLELGATPTRKMSQTNYQMLKAWLSEFGEERLLEMAQATHGGLREPVWNSESLGYRVVRQWTHQLQHSTVMGAEATSAGVQTAALLDGDGHAARGTSGTSPYDPELFHRYIQSQAGSPMPQPIEATGDGIERRENQSSANRSPAISSPPRNRSRKE
jgi:hypothetical protein